MRLLATLLAAALVMGGCSQGGGEITETREVDAPAGAPAPAASSSAERFGMQGMPAASAPASPGYRYTVPEGWKQQPPTQFRLANFTAGPNGEVEVFLSQAGGGLAANVNRWRNQLGLPALSEQEIDQLPRIPVLGDEAALVNWEGTYGGMQGTEKKENYRLAGVLLEKGGEGVFVKMTGPAAAVEQEMAHLEEFAKSLQEDPHAGMMAGGADPHAGMQMPPTGGDPHAGMTPEMVQALQADPNSTMMNAQLTWKAPESWQPAPQKPMRAVTFNVGENAEVYVSVLGGAAGGTVANINRWRTQMGVQEPLTADTIAAMPKINMLGQQCPLVEIEGSFQGMQGGEQTNAALLGAVCSLPDQTVFVKMTGPADVVKENRDEFIAFSESLAFGQQPAPQTPAASPAETPAAAPQQ